MNYSLSIIDSTNKYLHIFKKAKKVVSVNKERVRSLIRPVVYTLKRKNVTIQVMYLDVVPACYDKFNTFDGWIAIQNSRQLLKLDGLPNLIRQMDVEIGNNASVVITRIENDLMCEDAEAQEIWECSADFIEFIQAIEKRAPK